MKRSLPIALLVIMLLTAACQKGAPSRAVRSPVDTPPEIITINLGYYPNDSHAAILDQLITAFEKRYPEYRINKAAPPEGTSDPFAELTRRLKAGDYDLFPVVSNNGSMWVALDPYLDRSGPALQKVAKAADSLRTKGRLYGLPIMLEPESFLVNRTMWEAAGLTLPEQNWSWDEFREAAAKLSSGEGTGRVWGVGTQLHELLFSVWLMQKAGQEFWLADEADLREGLRFFASLVQTDKALPVPEVRDWGASLIIKFHAKQFFEQQAAVGYTTIPPLGEMNKLVSFPWDVLPMPVQSGGRPVMRVRPYTYSVSASSEKKDAAWEFLRFAVGPEGAAIVAANGAIPVDGSTVTQDAWAGRQPAPPAGMGHLLSTPWVTDNVLFAPQDLGMTNELFRLTNLCLRGEVDPDTAVTQYIEFRQKRVVK
jgi:multiple sugar transport system substrate-binding protein